MQNLLEEDVAMDEGEDDDDGVLDERIQKLEQEVARLQAEQGVKEEIALGVITGREVQNTIYGMRGDQENGAPASSVAKTRFVLPPSKYCSLLVSLVHSMLSYSPTVPFALSLTSTQPTSRP